MANTLDMYLENSMGDLVIIKESVNFPIRNQVD